MRFILLLFFVVSGNAQNTLTEATYEFLTTTDDIQQKSVVLKFSKPKRDFLWPYESEPETDIDFYATVDVRDGRFVSTNYAQQNIELGLGRKIEKFYAKLMLKDSRIENEESKMAKSQNFGQFDIFWKDQSWQIHFQSDSEFASERLNFPASLDSYLNYRSKTFNIHYFTAKMRMLTSATKLSYSDDNSADSLRFDLKFPFLKNQIEWLWIGFGYEAYKLSEDKVGYWTPEDYFAYGARAELAHYIFSNWQLTLNIGVNRVSEQSFGIAAETGSGHNFSLGILHGKRDSRNFKLQFSGINSAIRNEYKENHLSVSYTDFW